MIYELSFRGLGGSVKPGILSDLLQAGTVVERDGALIGYEQITFLIHGFNVGKQEGRGSLSRLAERLLAEGTHGAMVLVLWPGDSPVGPLSYPFTEGSQANDTAAMLARFIEAHVSDAVPVNFVAHSLGCRVTLETVKHLHKLAVGDRDIYPVGQVCLMAAAVDDYSLSIPQKYKEAAQRVRRVIVLSSVEDNVLKWIYPVGDLLQSFVFFWKESFGVALGYHGPKDYSVRRVDRRGLVRRQKQRAGGNVVSIRIDPHYGVDHGDYLPPSDEDEHPNDRQAAAANLAVAALAGEADLVYR